MELYVYSRDMTLQGIVEKISSLIWTRRYWSCGEFKLLVPFTEDHARLLVKENIIIKRGGKEAAEIRYIHITKNSQGMEEIEVQGKFLLSWIGKRILTTQIITKDTTQNILYAIVKQTCTNAGAARNIPNFSISTTDADTGSGQIDYTSEQYVNAQLAAETAAKQAGTGRPLDFVFFDLPGTINNPNIVKAIAAMDYIICPIIADRVVMTSSMQFATSVSMTDTQEVSAAKPSIRNPMSQKS